MRDAKRPGPAAADTARRPRLDLIAGLSAGLILAVLAFSQAAASVGIAISTFRPLGAGFFSWSTGQTILGLRLYDKGRPMPPVATLFDAGRTGLRYDPLSSQSLWLIGKGYELNRQPQAAARVMRRAAKMTRRDAAVQMWLGDAALAKGDVAAGLYHLDMIARTTPDATGDVITRLTAIVAAPQGRRYLLPYIRDDNPWLTALMGTAVTSSPRATPLARLLIERKRPAPVLPELEPIYQELVKRLAGEGALDVARQLYPLLPGVDRRALTSFSGVNAGQPMVGYPPFIWSFPDSDAQSGDLVGLDDGSTGMELSGASGTVGYAATKMLSVKPGARLHWSVHQRSTNLQSEASWVATCLNGPATGAEVRSVNLLAAGVPMDKPMEMAVPQGCDLVRVDLRIAGGIGREPASITFADMRLIGNEARAAEKNH